MLTMSVNHKNMWNFVGIILLESSCSGAEDINKVCDLVMEGLNDRFMAVHTQQ